MLQKLYSPCVCEVWLDMVIHDELAYIGSALSNNKRFSESDSQSCVSIVIILAKSQSVHENGNTTLYMACVGIPSSKVVFGEK